MQSMINADFQITFLLKNVSTVTFYYLRNTEIGYPLDNVYFLQKFVIGLI